MEKVAQLLQDKDFLAKLSETTTPEEAQSVFKANGADLTLSQLKVLRAQIVQKGGGELSQEDLDLVAGGAGDITIFGEMTGGGEIINATYGVAKDIGNTAISTAKDAYNWVASWGW